jgi:hypothetical protein
VLARAFDGLLVGALGITLGVGADADRLLLGVALDRLGALLGGLHDRRTCSDAAWASEAPLRRCAERCSEST